MMKQLIRQYLGETASRRQFLAGLAGVGISAAAADAMANSLAPFRRQAGAAEGTPPWMRDVRGTGGALLVAQLKAAGIRHIFCNPAGTSAPFFDALVDETDIHPIKALEEGALGAMADGYAKASGQPAFAMIDGAGVPAFLGQMHVSAVDQIPVVLTTDQDDFPGAMHSVTKSAWNADRAAQVPGATRQALKLATTAPCGPVFLLISADAIREEAQAAVMDQEKFSVPMKMRPDETLVQRAARLLIEARNPMLFVGDEVTWCGAEPDVVALAELLGAQVTQPSQNTMWSKPFPVRHPLFFGLNQRGSGYPGAADVVVNLGCRTAPRIDSGTTLIEVRLGPAGVASSAPVEVAIVADVKLAAQDLLAAIQSMATDARLARIAASRSAAAREYTARLRDFRARIGRGRADGSPISMDRLAIELEQVLEPDTHLVINAESCRPSLETFVNFGGGNKRWIGEGPTMLGWGVPAAFGVKLARPNAPVVAVVSDGDFMFRGPQPLWSYARYRAPVTVVVTNNHSYNGERNRLLQSGGRMFQTGRDMICYMGDPDIDFARMASSVGVEGETVREPEMVRAALERGKRANSEGRPYLIDVHVARTGLGAESTWHPEYSIAAERQRLV
jgi:benzoylformate decarboxylase